MFIHAPTILRQADFLTPKLLQDELLAIAECFVCSVFIDNVPINTNVTSTIPVIYRQHPGIVYQVLEISHAAVSEPSNILYVIAILYSYWLD